MRRLIISTLVSLVYVVPAAAQLARKMARQAAVQDQVITVPKDDGQNTDKESAQSIKKTLGESTRQWGSHRYRNGPVVVCGSCQEC